MSASPTRILLVAQEECQATYLETLLEFNAPGAFHVTRAAAGGTRPEADLVLFQVDGSAAVAPGSLMVLGADRMPVVVVARWSPDLGEVGQLMAEGADDVLALADLNARRLLGAILKALQRRGRGASLLGGLVRTQAGGVMAAIANLGLAGGQGGDAAVAPVTV